MRYLVYNRAGKLWKGIKHIIFCLLQAFLLTSMTMFCSAFLSVAGIVGVCHHLRKSLLENMASKPHLSQPRNATYQSVSMGCNEALALVDIGQRGCSIVVDSLVSFTVGT